MDDLMNKIQNVLNDEESMKQIKELADMLTADNGGQGEQGGKGEAPTQSPQNMDFSQLLQSLGGVSPPAESKPAQATQTGGLDIAKLMKIQSIMQSASKPDKNIQLLLALRPLLKEENQAKIDRLIKIFKLFAVYPALKESGLLGGDLLGLF
ncbi:hypothetical protein [Ruminococcus bicirculans (ex Wegman et al. 2014)]|uniref:hypothetical protein n=1 Tax=Ruminococcus bicirculans (ex Wegman et al. 2014) TaxID=1160721 RepID=UPI001FAC3AE8|nr:hypothetical protein [Ruminococcus bicirculans (ex Wegman et al. 2014)]